MVRLYRTIRCARDDLQFAIDGLVRSGHVSLISLHLPQLQIANRNLQMPPSAPSYSTMTLSRRLPFRLRRLRGFSMLELLVVIAIIALLASIILTVGAKMWKLIHSWQ